MNHLVFSEQPNYPIVFLVPSISKDGILKEYITPFGLPTDDIAAISLHYSQTKKKTPVAEMKEYIESELINVLENLQAKYLLVADTEYFKVLTGTAKADVNLGYVLPSVFGSFNVIYIPSYKAVFYDPIKIRPKIKQAVEALLAHVNNDYLAPGKDIIKFADYPRTNEEIAVWIDKLLSMDCDLTIDIEAFSLKHNTAGIGSITFCWNQNEGVSFLVDYEPIVGATCAPYGKQVINNPVRAILIYFFRNFKRKAIYHNISYDVYILIYQLFMTEILDTEGLLYGLDTMLANWEDTKLITYLATNSCAGNKLSLKDQAQAYAGNYAQEEINDITKIPPDQLLKYNLVDGLSTWYVHDKYYQKMIDDQQLDIYTNIFKPAIVDIIQMQLTGLPLNMKRVKEVKVILEADRDSATTRIQANPIIQQYIYQKNEDWVIEKNNTLKKKRVTIDDAKEEFNPGSGQQLQEVLFKQLGLPVIDLTKSKQPSTGKDTLKALKHHTTDPNVISLLNALIDFSDVDIILTTFITSMENAALGSDGWHYLFGNFNLGGTVSGRLSSSKPNLQNLPSTGSKYAKLIKSCFQAPPGWLFCGLDFASLEDRISALTTKDPNKLKVYTDGLDGHSLRAYFYFKEQMPDIIDTTESINSIQIKYKALRQESKAPTFACTYQGTFITLMKNCGFSEEKAKLIEKRYHELYAISDKWVQDRLTEASQTGYVEVAFGLRVRTPLLHQVVRGLKRTPYEAEAEGRTAGNALGQSWCLLNSRAASEFMGKVRTSKYRLDIRPCAHIHDAQYYLIRDNIDTILYTNTHLVKAVQWQEHPLIKHDEVKLGGELSIFYPDWSKELTIPNEVSEQQLLSLVQKHIAT